MPSHRGKAALTGGASRRLSRSTGSSETAPSRERAALKVSGPMSFMATDCATNAKPQIIAVSMRRRRYFIS